MRPRAGFTLVEVMVALVVIGVGALAIGSLFPAATRDIGESERTTRASEYLQEGMERLTSLTYNDPLLQPGFTHYDPANPLPGDFDRDWSVVQDYPISNCKTITMNVKWTEGDDEQVVTAVTAIASVGR
jgi:prepilin-type N-terminal cleavage/methylation domain-containing protein